ncbi:MAG: protein translocase subunit SecD [Alphaproteobacteria bacterium]|nr:protein translocase subunit SecD [Alphaproteobacteria bacterium]
MLHFSRTKIIFVALVCLWGVVAALPNFLSEATLKDIWPGFLPNKQLSLGLDLKGGAHLLVQMDSEELRKDWLKSLRGDVRKQLIDAKIRYKGLGQVGDVVRVKLVNEAKTEEGLTRLRLIRQPLGNTLVGGSGYDVDVRRGSDGFLEVAPTSAGMQQRISNASSAAIEVIRRRIDALGNVEPSIVRQGLDRILVQVPGFDDTEKLKELIGQTARLTFHSVHDNVTAAEARESLIPLSYVIHPDAEDPNYEHLLKEPPIVYGEDLVDAQPGFDQDTNEPIISFRFNQKAARIFAEFSSKNVGRPFAIVLDNGDVEVKNSDGTVAKNPDGTVKKKRDVVVLSAPVIREPILGGSGQISGNFSVEEANKLAVQVRSGALPTTLTIVEERTVGPSLGADSVEGGRLAAMVGGFGVAAFMLFAYGFFGLFALLAVIVNLVLIVGTMSAIGSTLTLPGIAGLILTIGMAVDANVLIYERIREEMRNGKQPISAIDGGFSRAFATIIDSNLTTLIAGIVMFWLGSGPIRGFAVTLSLGIFATVFTAFLVTRLLVSLWVARQKTRKIPAPL